MYRLKCRGLLSLSGGQSDELATEHLNAMNANHPGMSWNLTFSYGRALQHPALMAWGGNTENVENAQEILAHRARCNGLASTGKYEEILDAQPA